MAQIIVDPEPLSQSYLPQKFFHRDKENAQLVNNIKNRINTLIFGPTGSGKTTLVKLALSGVRDYLYVNCLLYNTEYSVLKEIIPSNRFIVCRSNYELLKEFQKTAKEKKLVVCFDNFTHLRNFEIIKKVMSLGVCTILVGRIERNSPVLKQNMLSNFPSVIKMEEYSVEQTIEIIKERARLALRSSSYLESTLRKIAEKIGGNITMAINILRVASLKAETENKYSINEADLESLLPENDCLDELSDDEKTIYEILSKEKNLPSNQLFTSYSQIAKYPKCERSFRNYMESLCSKGLVRAIGDKRGRVYEMVEADDEQAS